MSDIKQKANFHALQNALDSLTEQAISLPSYRDWCYSACSSLAKKMKDDTQRFALFQSLLFAQFGGTHNDDAVLNLLSQIARTYTEARKSIADSAG